MEALEPKQGMERHLGTAPDTAVPPDWCAGRGHRDKSAYWVTAVVLRDAPPIWRDFYYYFRTTERSYLGGRAQRSNPAAPLCWALFLDVFTYLVWVVEPPNYYFRSVSPLVYPFQIGGAS